ncbi:bifunctional 2',3'-cyclic-nucleotide 2'-phosphodiesterase/3'-nucleotidase [Lysinibacillus sp. LZ02]|uniref:bifunctional 2',3'-cyclic-nucleotide 2'-phosphodiesterase/3'-nucleotidase n=1 Tax=Lysinibacillus sp. LZ02 TaxID=3420668 RepID=UPI003D360A36
MRKSIFTGTVAAALLAMGLGQGNNVEAETNQQQTVTRGEYVVELIKSLDVELGDGSSVTFKDVSPELAPYVEKAIELKLVTGINKTTFAPDQQLTRLHAFVIAARGLQMKDAPLSTLNQFEDAGSIYAMHKQAIANAAAANLLQGLADGTIDSAKIVTPNQMQQIIERVVEKYNEQNTSEGQNQDEDKVTLRILGTSDIHTNLANYNYYSDAEDNTIGLANTATLIKEAQQENLNSVLVDNGDLIQGTPLGSYKALKEPVKEGEVHPAVAALNALSFDVATLGNHEFNYGLDYLDEVMDDADFAWVNANVRDAQTGSHYFEPYIILEQEVVDEDGETHTVNVGVTGIVPQQILGWDTIHLTGKVTVDEPIDALKETIPQMEAAGADVIVVLSHSGIGSDTYVKGYENVGYQITELEGVDAVVTGHSHATFPGDYKDLKNANQENGTINGVPTVMPGAYGAYLGVIDLNLEQVDGEWEVLGGTGEIRSIEGVEADKELLEAVKADHEGTIDYIRQPVGETATNINSYFALVQDAASIEIITAAQTAFVKEQVANTEEASLPILSAGAPFKAGSRDNAADYTNIPAGPLAIKNMADIYHFDNTVATVKVTGADVIEWLEMAAGVFATIDPNSTEEQNIIDTEARSYNFDVLDGVTYEIDITSPAKYDRRGNIVNEKANRIKNVQFNSQPIDLDQEFLVVANNYRVGGSYGAKFVKEDSSNLTIYAYENRQAIVDYIIEKGTVNVTPDNNWTFVDFPKGTKVIYRTANVAKDYIPKDSTIEYLGEDTNGFGKFLLK